MGIIDDYFDGYFSLEMIESQVCIPLILLLQLLYAHLKWIYSQPKEFVLNVG